MKTPDIRPPRTFTRAEEMIDELRHHIMASGRTYKQLGGDCKLASSTVGRIGNGITKWPRQTTLFPLIEALGLELELRRKKHHLRIVK